MTEQNNDRKNEPFLLFPAAKDYLWGGERLRNDFNKTADCFPLAETWECSTHPDGISFAASGIYQNKPLDAILREHPEYMGERPLSFCRKNGIEGLPILIKLIDAKKDLSVQVHPTDEYAFSHEAGQLGKSEAWYVLDAPKGASLIYGFKNEVKKDEIRKAIKAGTLEDSLRRIPVNKNDFFFIEAGTVHAIGAGALIAEIQESSNLTYRLYDYNRKDKDGKLRELHIDKALEVSNLGKLPLPLQPPLLVQAENGFTSSPLCSCKYFTVERIQTDIKESSSINYRTSKDTFEVFLCTEGSGIISYESASLSFSKGACIFLPANSVPMHISGQSQLLKISC